MKKKNSTLLIIIAILAVIIVAGVYFWQSWNLEKMENEMIGKNKASSVECPESNEGLNFCVSRQS